MAFSTTEPVPTAPPGDPRRASGPASAAVASSAGPGLQRALAVLFTATGASALALQVVWQRVISLHSGVDLASTTTVVAAFLAGLGLGSLAGGRLADRLGPRRSLAVFAAANVGIAVIAAVSTWLFYDLYRSVAPQLDTTAATFAFNASVLLVPTTLMGLSLPLLSRGVVDRLDDAAPVLGRLYGLNTMGAAAGAALTGWWLLGNFGFVAVTRLAGLVNLAVGLAVVVLLRRAGSRPEPAPAAADRDGTVPAEPSARVWPWMLAYAGTGAVALGLEQVFFRLVDAIMRSNSYSFAHVLSLYLALFGAGAAAGARLLRRGADPRRWFLRLQGAVAASALGGLVLLTRVAPRFGLESAFLEYFGSGGFSVGFAQLSTLRGFAAFVFAFLAAPLLIMGVPVFCAGAAYPCIQATVSDRVDRLGRRTGLLLFANVVGNVAGTLLTGYVLIDRLGTVGTLRLLGGVLGAAVVVATVVRAARGPAAGTRLPAAGRRPSAGRRLVGAAVVALLGAGLVVAVPSNQRLWAFLHGVAPDQLVLEEQRSCAVALKREQSGVDMLHINASSQNGYPFDDFHVLIGLLPALVHPAPERALAIGLGIGATAHGMASDPRVGRLDAVELCGGQYPLLDHLAERRAPELRGLLADPRLVSYVGDGRKHLLVRPDRYDIVTVDTLRPQTGYSGSLYSVEFYELVASRLQPGGILAQWAPTDRVLSSAAQVFPHVVTLDVASYNNSKFMLASREPLAVDAPTIAGRFAALAADAYDPAQRASLLAYLEGLRTTCVANGGPPPALPGNAVNRDLAPRDEYFLNNQLSAPTLANCA